MSHDKNKKDGFIFGYSLGLAIGVVALILYIFLADSAFEKDCREECYPMAGTFYKDARHIPRCACANPPQTKTFYGDPQPPTKEPK